MEKFYTVIDINKSKREMQNIYILHLKIIKISKVLWVVNILTELGDIKLSITSGTEYPTGCVRLSYYDKANSEKVRSSAIDDL